MATINLPNGAFVTGDWPGAVKMAVGSFTRYSLDGSVTLPDVETVRDFAIDVLQQWRGDQRAKMGLSAAQWQDLTYAGKAAHCRAWLLDTSQPFGMEREAAVRGLSDLQMAQLIVSQNDAWLAANDQIDAAYTAARGAIEAAATVAEIEAVLAGLRFCRGGAG